MATSWISRDYEHSSPYSLSEAKTRGSSKFIKYKPSQAFNNSDSERIIRMVEMPVDRMKPPKQQRLQREKIREERRKERERESRLDAATTCKKIKITRGDRDRDISEKVALGMAVIHARGEVMYDQRLFNREKGMDSGFPQDDSHNIYDKGLFAGPSATNTLYRPKKDAEMLEKKTQQFKPDKEFKKDQPTEEDPFGLDQFLTEVKIDKKAAMEKVGTVEH